MDFEAHFPAIRYADIHLEPGQAFPPSSGQILTPGSYVGRVTLKRDSVLRLGSGRYYFDDLDVQQGGILQMYHTQGHIEVYVRGSLAFSGRFNNAAGDQYANLFVVSNPYTTFIAEPFKGTLVATRGSIDLQNKQHYGAFYAAQWLQLHQGGAIHHRPLACNP
jgi:hypothetical protein